MSTWQKVKLKDCCISIADGDHQPPPKADVGVPFVTISNIDAFNSLNFENAMHVPREYYDGLDPKRRATTGDVLYSVVGSFGIPVLIKDEAPFVFQRHIAILRPDKTMLDSRFLYYTMRGKDFYHRADAAAIGAAQRTISLSALKNLETPLPPLPVQRRIADILSAYDDLIENNRKQIKLLEEAAQRLYKEWFIDLRFPGHEHTPIVNGIPAGWKFMTMGEVCETVGGGTPSTQKREYYDGGNIFWVTPSDITQNNCLILRRTEKKITHAGLKNSSAKLLPPYAILMTSRATVGYFAVCKHSVSTNQGFISCVPHDDTMRYFLLLNLMARVDEIRKKAVGATYLEINKSTFRQLVILVPPLWLLTQFSKHIQCLVTKMESICQEMDNLVIVRDRLLPKLMRGKIELKIAGDISHTD